MKICSIEGCNREVWDNEKECVLHCEKLDYSADYERHILPVFYDALLEYIIAKIKTTHETVIDEGRYRKILSRHDGIKPEFNPKEDFKYIYLFNIWFPENDSRDPYDYMKMLKNFQQLHFDSCTFSAKHLELFGPKVFFNHCRFKSVWHHYNFNLLENTFGFIYNHCIFDSIVDLSGSEENPMTFMYSVFYHCKFFDGIMANYAYFESYLFEEDLTEKPLDHNKFGISITQCEFKLPFIIDHRTLTICVILASRFNAEFRISSSQIGNLMIMNCQFKQVSRLIKTQFSEFEMENSMFSDLTSFEGSSFGVGESSSDKATRFEFVTFLSFCSFSGTNFLKGLNLHRVSMKETPNFLNSKVNERLTDRETFRIIKNSFDQVGNFIEGNKFYKLEMLKRKEELNEKKNSVESRLFSLYHLISDYGQSIGRPLIYIAITAVVYAFLLYGKQENWLYYFLPDHIGISLDQGFGFLNLFARGVLPYKDFSVQGMEFISLIFYIITTSLIWLVILAIKRHTKR